MPKIVLTLFAVVAMMAVLLQVRQQQSALRNDTLRLHHDIRESQRLLYQQQVLIGANLAPGAIENQLDVPLHAVKGSSEWGAVLER